MNGNVRLEARHYCSLLTTTTSRICHRPAPPLVCRANYEYWQRLDKTAKMCHGGGVSFWLKQNSFKTFLQLFCISFVTLLRTVLESLWLKITRVVTWDENTRRCSCYSYCSCCLKWTTYKTQTWSLTEAKQWITTQQLKRHHSNRHCYPRLSASRAAGGSSRYTIRACDSVIVEMPF